MSIGILCLWIVAVICTYCAVFAAGFLSRKKQKWWLSLILLIVKFFLASLSAFISLAVETSLPHLFGLLYMALCGDLLLDLILVISGLMKKKITLTSSFFCGLILTISFMTYSIVNMMNVIPNHHTYKTDKINGDHTIVFISDLHYGNSQTNAAVSEMFSRIKKEDPELIILGGDITDDFTSKEQLDQIYEQLGSLGIPVIYVDGNHDIECVLYTKEQLDSAIESNGITVLRDEYIELDDMVILGRASYSSEARLPVQKLPSMPTEKYVICVDHSPYEYDDISSDGADLQLSGHVHAGQLFPLRFIYSFGVHNIYGEYRVDDTDLCVSSGAAGWCYPFRTEAHSNFEVIHLVPE